MFRFSERHQLVQAIRDGVGEMQRLHVRQGWYDGHDLVNWMNRNRNEELNDIIDCYRRGGADPVHTATIQIGSFLKNQLGQQKIRDQTSARRITLRDGAHRNGRCNVSVWQIPQDTALGDCRGRTAHDS